ncbi:MAG TPA: hypothetical protein VEZ40_21480 [Pyrinomonadaceae bacterium]|nr:hypothetical protein [Pyrinomonadaceae bacterium]
MAKTIATIMGVVFILAGIVGFVDNDLLGFHLTTFHNAGVHIVSGAISLYFGLAGTQAGARLFDLIFGVVYAGLGVVGFLAGGHQGHLSPGVPGPDDARLLKVIPSQLELGTSDHILHIVLGLIFIVGALLTKRSFDRRADET